jgi:protein-tyrosine phosphatase
VIDLHCHLLPGVDDGPATPEDSVALARAAAAAGTETIVATPHIDGRWNLAPSELASRVEAVRMLLREAGVGIEVLVGGEIAAERWLDLTDEDRDALRLGGGPYVLLECPLSPAAGAFDHLVAHLCTHGERILLAHPERCPAFHRQPAKIAELVRLGALVQITAGSMAGDFGAPAQRLAFDLLRDGLVHDVSSDAHDAGPRRPPDMRRGFDAAEQALPGVCAQVDWLCREAPAAILTGDPLPRRPALPLPPPRRGVLGRLLGR